MQLNDGIESVPGVGEKTSALLRRRKIRTVRDLLYYLPRTYNNWQTDTSIADIQPGNVIIKAKVKKVEKTRAKSVRLIKADIYDDTGSVTALWFNQDYREKQLWDKDKEWYFSGVYEFSFGKYQLRNPRVIEAKEVQESTDGFQPVYTQCKTLKSTQIAKIVGNLKGDFSKIPDYLPEAILAEVGIKTLLNEALYLAHFPETQEDVDRARERLAFDELLAWSFSSEIGKRENLKLKAPKLKFDPKILQDFVANLPFDLTEDQRKSLFTIAKNMEKDKPMSRMLQGDVGSGKTVVAMGASLLAADNGFQVAIMAPTEVLARQHFASFRKNLPAGRRIALLVGGLPHQQKKGTQEAIKAGQFEIIIGTTALISDNVKFANLGLTIIDEQHRFGVRQRQKLLANSGNDLMPHLLSMTATPIPRSLQLAIFGEMSVSNIKSKPKGRKEIKTDITRPVSIETTYKRMRAELEKGHQVYYICPQIEDEEETETEIKKVKAEYKHLQKVFEGYNVAFLHGKMSAEEKTEIMQDFSTNKSHVLVSTTVIEVGVDVPNASFIVIRNADRFGLAALHQLRGRVGRGDAQSYCSLVTTTNDKPTQRLREMERSNDGFYLAEKDLEIRGAGEIYGALQHGALSLRIANITDSKTVMKSRRAAEMLADIVEENPSFLDEHKELMDIMREKQKTTVLN
ncbi:ATP-dependent DNA helicase RecG [Candidatus Saccharibacteria bacterium]|nr:ATP-dependent DNA helicase RecG [Candidatus Saccharibacteria bacterium]